VMDAGLARELASPKALLEDPDSMFAKLVQEYMGQPTLYATTQDSASMGNLAEQGFVA
jgi:hypothetical protein